jgi:phytoene synthase
MARDTSFYYSFLVLPPRKRNAIVAVWDFCRAVDDAVDEAAPGQTPPRAVRVEDGNSRPATRASRRRRRDGLQPYIREFSLPRTPFEELIDGVEMDLHHPRYETFDALVEYCRQWRRPSA